MDTRVENGGFVLGPNGLPETVEGLEELLQYARLRLTLRRGSLPYNRELGSGLYQWSPQEDRAEDRALALANEALQGLGGVRAVSARAADSGLVFSVATPLGEGEITLGDL